MFLLILFIRIYSLIFSLVNNQFLMISYIAYFVTLCTNVDIIYIYMDITLFSLIYIYSDFSCECV